MEYNFLEREVYMPKKYFRKDRRVKLGKHQNIFFATLWFSREHKAKYKEIFKRVYGYKDFDNKQLRNIATLLRRKGIDIQPVYKYGYKLNNKNLE